MVYCHEGTVANESFAIFFIKSIDPMYFCENIKGIRMSTKIKYFAINCVLNTEF